MKGLAEKLVEIRKVIKDPIKHGRNDYHGYDYATKDDVFEVVRPVMAAHGVTALPSQTGVRFEDVGEKGERSVVVNIELLLIDADSGDSYVQKLVGESHTKDDKGIPQATTQALRFWAINTFQLLDGEVEYDDVDVPQENVTRQKSTPTKKECFKDIQARLKELEFSKPQWAAFKVGLALEEGAESMKKIPHARLLVWRNTLAENDDNKARGRCLEIARKGRDHSKSAA